MLTYHTYPGYKYLTRMLSIFHNVFNYYVVKYPLNLLNTEDIHHPKANNKLEHILTSQNHVEYAVLCIELEFLGYPLYIL